MAKQDTNLPPTPKTIERSYLATMGGFGAILLWSTTIGLARSLSEQVGSLHAAAAVYGIGGLVGLVSFLRIGRRRQHILHLPIKYLLGCGALFVGYMLLLFLAIGQAENREQVLEVGLLNYLWPVLTLLLSVVLLGKKANWLLLPGTLLALAGVFVVLMHGETFSCHVLAHHLVSNPGAYALALVAAVF
jgi:drug/metabolite transporter (DMT)-like permease